MENGHKKNSLEFHFQTVQTVDKAPQKQVFCYY